MKEFQYNLTHIFYLPPTASLKHAVLPVLLPAGHAGCDCVRQDVFIGEDTAAHPGCSGVLGPLPSHLRPEVRVPRQPALQRHQVSDPQGSCVL